MLDQLRNQYFESNPVVKNYLNPTPPSLTESVSVDKSSTKSSSPANIASSVVSSISGLSGPPYNSSLSFEKSLYTFDTLCEPFKKIVDAFQKLYTFKPDKKVFYEISELVLKLKEEETRNFFEDAKTKIKSVFDIYFEAEKKASESKKAKLEELKKSSDDEISKIDGKYDPDIRDKEKEFEKIKDRVTQAQKLFDSSWTPRYDAQRAFELLNRNKDVTTDSPEYKSALTLKESTKKDLETASEALKNPKKELEDARNILLQLMREKDSIKEQIEQKKKSETKTINEAWDEEKEKALQVARNAINVEKSIINEIFRKARDINYIYFLVMGITIQDNQVEFNAEAFTKTILLKNS